MKREVENEAAGDPSILEMPRTAAGEAWSQPESMEQAVCDVNSRARKVQLCKSLGAQKVVHES